MQKTIRSRRGGNGNRFFVNVLELMGTGITAYVMIDLKRHRLPREGELMLMRWDSSLAVSWVFDCSMGKREDRCGGTDNCRGDGADRGMVFPGKARAGRGQCVS